MYNSSMPLIKNRLITCYLYYQWCTIWPGKKKCIPAKAAESPRFDYWKQYIVHGKQCHINWGTKSIAKTVSVNKTKHFTIETNSFTCPQWKQRRQRRELRMVLIRPKKKKQKFFFRFQAAKNRVGRSAFFFF